ncbi:MAG: insulinase family protein [Gemmatimonadetes bacterium]|nr:insulinase family protein [Gemmatimonadota bacterium]
MIKTYALITFLVCVLSSTSSAYQLIGTAALSEELIVQHYTINPRLDAVIVVDRTTPTFEYQTFYCAGSADEEEGKQGRLHFLEHIMAGTGSHEYGKLNQIIVENGGQRNAFTSTHYTHFILRFPKDKLDLAVEIDSERYYNTMINEEVIEKEKKIVLTERSRSLPNLTRRFTNYFFSLIYKKKNFNTLGTEDFIKQLEPVGLKAYYENFLRHQKRLVVVIGDVDIDHVLTKLDEAYGNEQIPGELSGKFQASQFPNPEILGRQFKITSKNLSISKFRKSWYTPSLGHRDYAGLLILTTILNKTANSLTSYIVDSELARIFILGLSHYKGFGLISCLADLWHDTSSDAIQAIIRVELEKLKSISEDELDASRNELLHSMYSEFYDRSSMADSFGRAFAHANDPLLYPKLLKNIKSIHREDIPRIIDQYLTDDNSITLSLTLPTQEKSSLNKNLILRTPLHYGIMILIFAGFLTLLVWGGKKLHRKFSRKANEYVSESDT